MCNLRFESILVQRGGGAFKISPLSAEILGLPSPSQYPSGQYTSLALSTQDLKNSSWTSNSTGCCSVRVDDFLSRSLLTIWNTCTGYHGCMSKIGSFLLKKTLSKPILVPHNWQDAVDTISVFMPKCSPDHVVFKNTLIFNGRQFFSKYIFFFFRYICVSLSTYSKSGVSRGVWILV